MKTFIQIVIFTLISSIAYSQDYSPLNKGEIKYFDMRNGSYTNETLKEEVEINKKLYTPVVTTYSWGDKTTSYVRYDEDGNRIYLDSESILETIEFPADIKIGYKWESTDEAWSYEILAENEKFKTKNTEFNNCLVIKAVQLIGRDKSKYNVYLNFYVDKIGYVGSTNNKRYVSWLVDNK